MPANKPANLEKKDLKFELKTVSEDGTFDGYLSVYDIVDLGNDQVQKGAFTKTMKDNNNVVPLLWNHDDNTPIGSLQLSDDDHGLKVHGTMFVKDSPKAAEIHAVAKHFHGVGRPMGLSIGYEAVQKAIEKGVRMLKEIKLWEGSMTLFPMLQQAQLTAIKSAAGVKQDAFIDALQEIQMRGMRYQILDALDKSLGEQLMAGLSDDEVLFNAGKSIENFRAIYLEYLPNYIAMVKSEGKDGAYQAQMAVVKSGRRNSAADVAVLRSVVSQLQALIADEAAEPGESGKSTSKPPAATSAKEPVIDHSAVENRIAALRSLIPASGKSQIN